MEPQRRNILGRHPKRRLFSIAALVVAILTGVSLYIASGVEPDPSNPSTAQGYTQDVPGQNLDKADLSKEAQAVHEGHGVENSYGVLEVPRPEPDAKKAAELGQEQQLELDPLSFDDSAETAAGVHVKVGKISQIKAEASLPGEVAGQAVRVPVSISNETEEEISTRDVVINVFFGEDEVPGVPVISARDDSFPLVVEPGATATTHALVVIPEKAGSKLTVTVNLQATEPVAIFVGQRANATSEKKKS